MNDLRQAIAKNISSLRSACSMTQAELAQRLNYSDKAVSKWERAESVPDITVLKEIADMFGVTVDYLLQSEHKENDELPATDTKRRLRNRTAITGMCILLVWLVAMLTFVVLDATFDGTKLHWLAYAYAVPVSMIVWLIFNSVWFNKRRNFLIISALMWTALAAIFLTLLLVGFNVWRIFLLGIPGQAIILLWSRITGERKKAGKKKEAE